MRKNVAPPRAAVSVTVAVVLAGLAVAGCTNKLGAAAITGNSRISSATLTSQVANLNTAYGTDKAKGIKPQRSTGQEPQQVLTWLILFRIYDQVAVQHNISVTQAQIDTQLNNLSQQAASNKVTLQEYVTAAGALPPDLTQELGRYFVILGKLESSLDGGKAPTSTTGQAQLGVQLGHQQCLAAKSLGVTVNPQFGEFDYRTYSVVLAPSTLAADATPSPSSSPALLQPPC